MSGPRGAARWLPRLTLPLLLAFWEVGVRAAGIPEYTLPVPWRIAPSLAEHAVSSLATAANMTLHVNLRAGRNVHHIIEATFKGLARCLRDAVRVDSAGVPSTKGVLS